MLREIFLRARPPLLAVMQRSNFYSLSLREVLRLIVPRVRVTSDADAGIIGQHSIEPLVHFRRTIRDDDLPGVQRIANTDTTAMMKGNPACTGSGVQQCVQYRPVGDGIASV